MNSVAKAVGSPDYYAAAFEHSITWEDDVWQADPVDVEEVHSKARQKFYDVLGKVTGSPNGNGATQHYVSPAYLIIVILLIKLFVFDTFPLGCFV